LLRHMGAGDHDVLQRQKIERHGKVLSDCLAGGDCDAGGRRSILVRACAQGVGSRRDGVDRILAVGPGRGFQWGSLHFHQDARKGAAVVARDTALDRARLSQRKRTEAGETEEDEGKSRRLHVPPPGRVGSALMFSYLYTILLFMTLTDVSRIFKEKYRDYRDGKRLPGLRPA